MCPKKPDQFRQLQRTRQFSVLYSIFGAMGSRLSAPDKTVVIIGGGYAGVAAATRLDGKMKVVLIERREAMVHCLAGLRSMVAHGWVQRTLVPYDKLLKNGGRVLRGEVVRIMFEGCDKFVELGSGEQINFDVLLIAAGASQDVLV